jgi:hypothetical protein
MNQGGGSLYSSRHTLHPSLTVGDLTNTLPGTENKIS